VLRLASARAGRVLEGMGMLSGKADHVFHVWINREADKNAENVQPIDPHKDGLYDFKSAMNTLPYLTRMIEKERKRELPMVHQQCSRQSPEPLPENFLTCAFGVKLRECQILARLNATFDEMRSKPYPDGQPSYYRDIPDSEIDKAKAMACVWHMLMGNGKAFVDWNEGAVQDESDKIYWRRVYDNLAEGMQGEATP
jgi:hypothetical protein